MNYSMMHLPTNETQFYIDLGIENSRGCSADVVLASHVFGNMVESMMHDRSMYEGTNAPANVADAVDALPTLSCGSTLVVHGIRLGDVSSGRRLSVLNGKVGNLRGLSSAVNTETYQFVFAIRTTSLEHA